MGVTAGSVEGVDVALNPNPDFWRNRRVLVTGHTGFKGGWLCLWLQSMQASVYGFALPAATTPSLWRTASVEHGLAASISGDVRDRAALTDAINTARPEIIFHLAAQPLVRESYRNPADTFEVNVIGVVNLLEAARTQRSVKAVVQVTTDKCYQNVEQARGYTEDDALGGRDPYSSSKACGELVTAAYRDSFLSSAGVGVCTARAGNVIGGGDWSPERLIPDIFRALDAGLPMRVRFPNAVRPWQHVLEPLAGYLLLAEGLCRNSTEFSEPWNFGPDQDGERTVGWVIDRLSRNHPTLKSETEPLPQPHEASVLTLDSTKARTRLGWRPRWNLATALDKTSEWWTAWKSGTDMRGFTSKQIREYVGR